VAVFGPAVACHDFILTQKKTLGKGATVDLLLKTARNRSPPRSMTEADIYDVGIRLEFQFLDIEILFSEVSTAAILTRVLVQFELARQLRHTADAAGLVLNFRLGLHFGGVVLHLVHVFMFVLVRMERVT